MMKIDLVDITVQIHAVTDNAVLVSDDGDRKNAVWLPRSQIEIDSALSRRGDVMIAMPEWLAKDKGLL